MQPLPGPLLPDWLWVLLDLHGPCDSLELVPGRLPRASQDGQRFILGHSTLVDDDTLRHVHQQVVHHQLPEEQATPLYNHMFDRNRKLIGYRLYLRDPEQLLAPLRLYLRSEANLLLLGADDTGQRLVLRALTDELNTAGRVADDHYRPDLSDLVIAWFDWPQLVMAQRASARGIRVVAGVWATSVEDVHHHTLTGYGLTDLFTRAVFMNTPGRYRYYPDLSRL